MHFSALFALAALNTVTALITRGPYGDIAGAPGKQQADIPLDATIKSISCRGNHRLDHVEVVYRVVETPNGRIDLKTASYGSASAGNFQGIVDTTRTGEHVDTIAVYTCTTGKAKGLVCGLKIVFSKGSILKCGIDPSTNNAALPGSWRGALQMGVVDFHAFVVETRKGGDIITKIGWTEQ